MSFRSTFPLLCLSALCCSGCVTTDPSQGAAPSSQFVPVDRIRIQQRFAVVDVNAANLGNEAHRCVQQLAATSKTVVDQAAKLPLPRGTVVSLSNVNAANSLVIVGSRATCLQQSTARHPIFAAEIFVDTVNPSGVPPAVTDKWYADLARRIAETGRATAAYVFPNGNAFIASYWVEPPLKTRLAYASEFKKAGTWESGTYDFRFVDPNLSSVTTVARNGAKAKMAPIDYR